MTGRTFGGAVRAAAMACLCLLALSRPVEAGWQLDAETAFVHDDNLTNAYYAFDVVGDWALDASVAAGRRIQLDGYSSLSVAAVLSGEKYFEVTGLDRVAAGVRATYRRKLGLGLEAPWVAVEFSTEHLSHEEDARDGWRHRVTLSAGRRLGRRWDLWAEAAFERRSADHVRPAFPGFSGAVFNLSSVGVKLNAVHSLGSRLFLTVGYELRRGDVVSTLLVFQPGESIYEVSTAVAADPAFGPEAYAYRLKGTSHTVGARLTALLGDGFAASLEYQRIVTLARGGNDYTKNIVRLSMSYQL